MTAGPREPEHIRVRPSWDCAACGRPWPCADAKRTLLREFGRFRSVLKVFMATQMYDAFDDLAARGALPPAHLHQRFLGWIVNPPRDEAAGPADDVATPDRPEDRTTEDFNGDDDER